jgi:rare lipoprotein A (peptidoglycan hydrolase)
MRVAGLTAGAVLTAVTVAPDQGAAMMSGGEGSATPGLAEQQPTRFVGLPDKGAALAAALRAARTPPKPPRQPRPTRARTRAPDPPATTRVSGGGGLRWTASWYGPGFAGQRTASGEVFDPNALTCAHRTLPFGTRLQIRNPDTGRSVWVRVNDRGPYAGGRQLDLSQGAAEAIGLAGVGQVIVRVA